MCWAQWRGGLVPIGNPNMVMVWIGWKPLLSMGVLLGVAIGRPTGNAWERLSGAPARIAIIHNGCLSKMFISIGWGGEEREPVAATGAGRLG